MDERTLRLSVALLYFASIAYQYVVENYRNSGNAIRDHGAKERVIFLYALKIFSDASLFASHSEVDLQSLFSRPACTLLSSYTLTAAAAAAAAAADVVVSVATAAIALRRNRRNTFDVSNQNTEEEQHGKTQEEEWEVELECLPCRRRRRGHFARNRTASLYSALFIGRVLRGHHRGLLFMDLPSSASFPRSSSGGSSEHHARK